MTQEGVEYRVYEQKMLELDIDVDRHGAAGNRKRYTCTDDPDGDSLDLDDLRLMWEEFVDALRDASGVADVPAETSDADDHAPDSYQALEAPVMKRNPSFASLCQELSNHCSPEGSNRGIKRVSSKGTLFGVGASSRDPSLQGASALGKPLSSAVESAEVAAALFKLEKAI